MSDATAFSPDYTTARARFRSGAHALGYALEEHPIGQVGPDGEELTIDIARTGVSRPSRAVVVSSGLHGVEGYFGSAVQAALLEDRLGGWSPPEEGTLILIHAVNPYGFAWVRRVNEDNVDLNRNFLTAGQEYAGSPPKYGDLDGLLNPKQPSGSAATFLPRAAFNILRHGMPALKNAVAGGQYEFPMGLFFGGSGPQRSNAILAERLPALVGGAERVFHVDFHTGLGASATYKLLVDHAWGSDGHAELRSLFGEEVVEPWEPKDGVSYEIRGGLGTWCKANLGEGYDVLCAEYGTVPILKVIEALHQENRAAHWGVQDSPGYRKAKGKLMAAFAPADRQWRDSVVASGLDVCQRAIEAAFEGC